MGAVGLALVLIAIGCGGSSSTSSTRTSRLLGTLAKPATLAYPLRLKDSLGHEVNIRDYRGKAVLLTFIYTHCPDVCPLIVGHLHAAQSELRAEASHLQIIAVSVDPRGDTPKAVNAFLEEHQMTGRMEYLIGSRPQLEKVWKAWFIRAKPETSKKVPNLKNPDLVEHSALVYGISAGGTITTLYPPTFAPHEIVHDVPILASQ